MDNLGDFFSLIGEEKKKETDRVKRELYKKEKQLDEIKKEHKVLENLFCDETPKPIKTDDWREDYSPIEIESYDIIKPEPLKPSPGAEKYEISEGVEKWKQSLDHLKQKENWITENLEQQDTVQAQIDLLRKQLAQTQAKVEVQGGGGATWLWDLDDVNIGYPGSTGYPPITDGSLLIYDDSSDRWVGIASTSLTPGVTDLQHVLETDNIAGLGMSVGFITATGMNVSGNVTIGGTLTYEDVKNVDAIGIITARKGIVSLGIVTSLGFDGNVTAGVVTATTFLGNGNGMTGIVTNIIAGDNISVNANQGQVIVTGLANTANVRADTLVVTGVSTLGIVTGLTSLQVTDLYATTSKISGNVIIDGDVSIAGTLTKKDVTEINSVGLITANNGINVVGGNIDVLAGDVYVSDMVTATDGLFVGVVTATSVVVGTTTDHTLSVTGKVDSNLIPAQNQVYNLGNVDHKWNNVYGNVLHSALLTTNRVSASSSVTATSFYGDGSGLTGLANTDRITTESLVVLGVTTSFGGIVVDRTSAPNNVLTAKLNGVTKAQIVANGNAQFASLTATGTLNVTGVSTLTTVNASSFVGPLTGSSTLVGGVSSTFLLNYDNFTNTPTNLNQFVNGPGYVTNNVTGDFAVSGNLSIGGTLTYEDVKNVDSVGIVTARAGLVVGTGATIDRYGNGDFVGVITAASFIGPLNGTATNASQLNSQPASFYLNYNNFTNASDLNLDTLVVSGLSTFSTMNVGGDITLSTAQDIGIIDNSGLALRIMESGSTEYLRIVTLDGNERIETKKTLETDGLLSVGGGITMANTTDIQMADNSGFAFRIREGNNEYMRFTTTDGGEKIVTKKALEVDGALDIDGAVDCSGQVTFSGAQTITIPDNLGFGLRVSSADNAEFVRFTTTDGSELVDFSKNVKLDGGLTLNSSIDAKAGSVDITMIDSNSNAIDFVIDGGNRMMRFNTNTETVLLEQNLEVQGQTTVADLNITGVTTLGTLGMSGDLTLTDTNSGTDAGPELTLFRDSSTPDDGDYLGQLMFKGRNDNGGEENYAKVTGKISDASLGTEDGLIETAIKGNGSFTIVSRQRSDELQLINGVGISVDGNLTLDNVSISSIQTSGETFVDNDTTLMTAAATEDRFNALGGITETTGTTTGTFRGSTGEPGTLVTTTLNYVKIGKLVITTFNTGAQSFVGYTGTFSLEGFFYTAATGIDFTGTFVSSGSVFESANNDGMVSHLSGGSTTLELRAQDGNNASVTWSASGTDVLQGTIMYYTN